MVEPRFRARPNDVIASTLLCDVVELRSWIFTIRDTVSFAASAAISRQVRVVDLILVLVMADTPTGEDCNRKPASFTHASNCTGNSASVVCGMKY
jgi:hypothetical protein